MEALAGELPGGHGLRIVDDGILGRNMEGIEDGQDPSIPERYGWRFLRAAQDALRESVG
ncbi:hypothetical protein [Streptomyces sp. NPDC098101]|uniref:hypothetical protein n=1 Tax=Streptomyces sp. NPDC098101 TaxID=3366096 RepID=UPI003807EE6E